MRLTARLAATAFACALMVASLMPALGKDPAPRRELDERQGPAVRRGAATIPLNVYEWGVETLDWTGAPEGDVVPDDLPEHFHDALALPIDTARPAPAPQPNPNLPQRRKPVVYFNCARDVVFDVDVKFAAGNITWLYPRPTRMVSRGHAQWDNIELLTPDSTRWLEEDQKPMLPAVSDDHWAAYSRAGADDTIIVNGEREQYLFYEGDNAAAWEADVYRTDDGRIMIANHSQWPLHDVRFHLPTADGMTAWHVDSIPAATTEGPSVVELTDGDAVEWADFAKAGVISAETKAAGLTGAQADVFERAWVDLFFRDAEGTLSFRRDEAALEAMMSVVITTTPGVVVNSNRIGYVYVHGIELDRTAELDAVALNVALTDGQGVETLHDLGMAGMGALRRVATHNDLTEAQRLVVLELIKAFPSGK